MQKILGKDSITHLLKDSREFNKGLAKRMLLQNRPRNSNSTLYKKEIINIFEKKRKKKDALLRFHGTYINHSQKYIQAD